MTATGGYQGGIDYYYREALAEVDELTSKYGVDADEARDGVLFYRVGNTLEVDLTVTDRHWLLAERSGPGGHLANVASPDEALALIGLFLGLGRRDLIVEM